MAVDWQYLSEGDKFRWYRLVSRENLAAIEADLEHLRQQNQFIRRGVPVLAPWKLIKAMLDRSRVRKSLKEHLQKFAEFHRDMLATEEYARAPQSKNADAYAGYPDYGKSLEIRARVRAELEPIKAKPKPPTTAKP